MTQPRNSAFFLVTILVVIFFISGCVRLVGKAGYVKQTPTERTERVAGFDTNQLFDGQKTKESIK